MTEDRLTLIGAGQRIDQLAVGRDDIDVAAAIAVDPHIALGIDDRTERLDLGILLAWRGSERNVDGSMRIAAGKFRDGVVSAIRNPNIASTVRNDGHRPRHVALRVTLAARGRRAIGLKQ